MLHLTGRSQGATILGMQKSKQGMERLEALGRLIIGRRHLGKKLGYAGRHRIMQRVMKENLKQVSSVGASSKE
eukprot:766364-Hanusia_phi.AAC.6